MENISYENYLKCKDALSFEYCQKIHQAILLELGAEPDILEIWHDFLKASMDYAYSRSQWLLWESAEHREKDEGRTAKHEIVIYNFKLLSRNMEQSSEVVNYLKEIENNRKQIGDFVSYLAYIMQLIQDKYNKLFQEFHIVKIYKKGTLSKDKAPFTFNCPN